MLYPPGVRRTSPQARCRRFWRMIPDYGQPKEEAVDQFACRLLGEIRYPEDYSFERVAAIEAEAGPALEEALASLGVSRLEVAPGPESLRFEVWCDACSPEEGGVVCEALVALAGDGPLGRVLIVRAADEPMTVFYFCGENLDEVTVEQPYCRIGDGEE